MGKKLKDAIKGFKPYYKLYVPLTLDFFDKNFEQDDIKKLKFNFQNRTYTFNKNILNHIYASWQIRNGEKRNRKIGKIIDNKFVFELDNGDRLTKKEIAEIVDFLNKNLNEAKEDNLPYIKLINSQNLTKEEWLKQRQLGIGGSDLGAILGLSKWSNPYKIWLEKTGQAEKEENSKEKQRMFEIGTHNEELVAKYFSEDENKEVKIEPYLLQNKQHPFMLANIDRWVVGENAGLEIKTTSNFAIVKDLKQGKVPEQYQLQCLHYMAVTGADCWYISTFDLVGKKLYTMKIERTEEVNKLIDFIIQKEKDFWEMVTNKIEPEINIDGDKETTKRLLDLNFNTDEQVFLSDESGLKLLDSLDQQIKDLEKQKEKIKQDILLKMDGNNKAITENYEIKVIETTRNTFDKKKLFELVEIDEEIKEKCTKTSTSRTLKIKKMEV